ncbi:glycoside hydrolase family 15 protein [Micromonospora yasonensis]|nr:glycoside hydrolase family 15 protein [Micromonospora yasonensis]MCW3842021.1 glycoside hydrolase family 15 protein [Micromonospora yasonensis]
MDRSTVAEFTVAAGERVPFVLTWQPSHRPAPTPVDAAHAIAGTERYWREWISRCAYDGRWPDAVRRALITLKALTYAPTGGILAAATTSLPEQLGGPRNWDYRYCWLRDATFTLQALLGTGYVAEAKAWREWLLRAIAGDPADLQIMYALDGTRRIPEQTLDWLGGYAGSAPVRIGNAAAEQLQLDVWGEVLDGLQLGREAGIAATEEAWDVQRALLDFLEGNWRQPDNGRSCCATGPSTTTTSTGCPAARAPSWPAPSGWSTPCTTPAVARRRRRPSPGCSTCATTWACSARSTTRQPAGSSATPRRRSAWSGWSTRRASSAGPAPAPRRPVPSSAPRPSGNRPRRPAVAQRGSGRPWRGWISPSARPSMVWAR